MSAFDTAWPPAIIAALGRKDCPPYLIAIVENFLRGRRAALFNQEHSLEVDVEVGCPQGSLLSPFLWNVLIDDLLRLKLPGDTKIIAYADDITLITSHKDPKIAVETLKEAVEVIRRYLEEIKLSINATKTVLMVFSKKNMPIEVSMTIDGHVILPSKSTKLLGVILDENLKWMRAHRQRVEVQEGSSCSQTVRWKDMGSLPSSAKNGIHSYFGTDSTVRLLGVGLLYQDKAWSKEVEILQC